MRIISKFRDYYDGVMKTGMDREVVYLRENKDILIKGDFGLGFSTNHTSSYHIVDTLFLGYCGQIFKVIVVSSCKVNPSWKFIFYDFDEFKSFMMENKLASKYEFGERHWWPSSYIKFRDFDTNKLTEIFHKYQTPLFVFTNVYRYAQKDSATISLGPYLEGLEFQRIKDPYTAFQDIFQYVAGTLNKPENRMVKISDKDKIAKRGFDKWSFRKMPTKKK